MSATAYLNFDLLIESEGAEYRASVVDSPVGEESHAFTLPFSEKDLKLLVYQVMNLSARRSVRAIAAPEMRDVRSFGGTLFESVFSGPIGTCLLRSMDEADRTKVGLRVRLHLGEAPTLANIPWEFLYDASSDDFLCLSDQTPVVRYLDLPQRVEPLSASPPLRMLCLISSPAGYPPLNVEHEWKKLSDALAPIIAQGRLVLERVDTPTLEALQRRLRRDAFHVLHFIGHGAFDEQAQDGVLLFEDLDGRGRPVAGESLGVLLHDHESMRLVVLNACEGARTSSTDPFAGTAQSLVRKGIPAVIAMQFEISDQAAITLAGEFYSAVADGYPVDASVAEARKAIFTRVNAVEWATPVLYMRSPDGRIFDIEDHSDREEARAGPPAEPGPTATEGHRAPVAVVESVPPEPATRPVAAEPQTTPAAVGVATDTAPPSGGESEAPVRSDRRPRPATPGGTPSLWQRRRLVIPAAIATAIALIVGVVALATGGGKPTASPSGKAASARPSGPAAPTSLATTALSKVSFAPVPNRDIESAGSGAMLRLVWAGGRLFAVGSDASRGAVWASNNGLEWSRRVVPFVGARARQRVQGIAAAGAALIAVGWEQVPGQHQTAAVWFSTDNGATWHAIKGQDDFRAQGDTLMNRISIVNPGAPVAVGSSGKDARLWPSEDGVHWDRAVNPVFDGTDGRGLAARDLAQSRGVVVVVGEETAGQATRAVAWFHDDAVGSWDRGVVRGATGNSSIVSVVATTSGFLAVGYDSPRGDRDAAVWSSSDGRRWDRLPTQRDLHRGGDQVMRGVVSVPGLGYMAVGVDGSDAAVWISTDGKSWARSTRALESGDGRQMTGIVRTDTMLVVAGVDHERPGLWTAQLPAV